MKEFVFVSAGQEDTFIARALTLGITQLVLVYSLVDVKKRSLEDLHSFQSEDLQVFFGVVLDKPRQVPKQFTIKIGLGTKMSSLFGGLTHIYFNEGEIEKDFIHQRRSGLNHIFLAECKNKRICVITSYVELQTASLQRKAQLLGRMSQNKMLCEKKKVSYFLVSGATRPEQLRKPSDREELYKEL
ncbi:MAG: hypothetical protein ACLFNM_00275 [Candidatus Woesearchaeota archaeon]